MDDFAFTVNIVAVVRTRTRPRVKLANGVLVIKGEKKTETKDKDRLFSKRYYSRFERRIPVEGVDEDKISASFRNDVLTVTLPKTVQARNGK